jgi:hypothetical protein
MLLTRAQVVSLFNLTVINGFVHTEIEILDRNHQGIVTVRVHHSEQVTEDYRLHPLGKHERVGGTPSAALADPVSA